MLSIYEALQGKHLNGEPLSEYPNREDRLASIHDHLMRLLNARQGVLAHLPDYGLPDLNHFYQELPYSETDMAQAVKDVIEKYEPRLRRVQVTPLPRDIQFSVVRMEIAGWVVGGDRIRFRTLFKSSGEAEVQSPQGR
ncbi:type VI secretion system baseplate subunit TssE [Saccharospirillum salsuginis]|uniref:Type VI secretion system protein n=1 Tax=Saccharospirillum salsuginis TaxID=418750 RepID=A0A918JZW2_9GAMM|nr:type VI secretion system baseplate subunit TssE [Saccharospirillum salsuginis]GGX39281.1 type VI secretion system protein [Saccharospirillum salsuginis]